MNQGQLSRKRFRPNKHQLLTNRIISRAKLLLVLGFGDDLEDDILDETAICLHIIRQHRYLRASTKIRKCSNWFANVLPHYAPIRFRAVFRMSKESFLEILGRIESDPIFESKFRPQIPVIIQLAITLSRFGHFGNMASYFHIAKDFGISDCGTVQECTRRVMAALLKWIETSIKWPDATERQSISDFMARQGFRHCIGFVDGSHLRLNLAPLEDSKSYYNRKCFNSIQVQVICNPNRRIIHSVVGYPGAVHDSKVFRECSISRKPADYFSRHQFILGDAGYKLQSYLITPYKRTGTLSTCQEHFNKVLSHNRVGVEHVFGVLKSRFQSLNGLRIQVNRERGHKYACDWIQCTLILYNYLLELDPWTSEDISENSVPADDDMEDIDDDEADVDGSAKREILARYLVEFN